MSSAAAFTCITCRVSFADADLQRSHYKTDWHRYNLKRKVADLPHVTVEGFNQRVLAQKAQALTAEQSKLTSFYCEPCGKKMASEAAYQNHLNSAKHKLTASKAQDQEQSTAKTPDTPAKPTVESKSANAMDTETNEQAEDETNEWEDDVFGIEECLFCRKISKSLVANVKHMTSHHSFFLPNVEYLVDLEGLISYLGEKIGSGKMCLWCNEKSKVFHSVRATQQHMLDKGHCMLQDEGDAAYEYTDFYDFTSSYPDGRNANPDEEVEVNAVDMDDNEFELTLPSGAKVGHRALAKYYKQNLVSRMNPEGRSVVNKVMSHYKALGWTGATGSAVERRVKDMQFMQRTKNKHWQKLGVKANKTAQTHFRPQVVF
ncbi:cytoplasmic 60S subunit biogenesis factor ZNF622-like [Watersipora subatra]|uniref:cytoplasmic 60S subunit biogenesis factor ZNF622-like n=1 Tax=Watersipora subatra TaxID=2589382 RepID=UPI00355C958C